MGVVHSAKIFGKITFDKSTIWQNHIQQKYYLAKLHSAKILFRKEAIPQPNNRQFIKRNLVFGNRIKWQIGHSANF